MAKTRKDSSLDSNQEDLDDLDMFDTEEEVISDISPANTSDIRRKIDDLLERKRLRDEFGDLDDFDF